MIIPFELTDIIRAFNRAASSYSTANMIPLEIGQRLLERLQIMRIQPELVVDLGCADGYLSKQLAQRYRNAKILCVDIASKMLMQAKQKSRWFSRERFFCADANYLPFADQSVDLIFSNLMFAWCRDIDTLLHELRRILKPQGLLLFTTFGPDTLQELKSCWRTVDEYDHVHPFLDMHDIGDSLVKNKFLDPVMDMEKLIIHYSQLSTLMNDLKILGMHNIAANRKKGFTTPRQFTKLQQAYERYLTPDATFPATLEVIYGHAWSYELPQSSINAKGEAIIPITKIKRKHI
jgi:malonyl-CoA O-methyltransferase